MGNKKVTKQQKVLDYMKSGKYISDAVAAQLFNDYRLSGTIFELRKKYNVLDRWTEHNGYKFKEYYLAQDNID